MRNLLLVISLKILLIICKDLPSISAGIILPLQESNVSAIIRSPKDLPKIGQSLVGWLEQNSSFFTFLDSAPTFEFPSDFRLFPLPMAREGLSKEDASEDSTLIVVPRKVPIAMPSQEVVETVHRLLELIYEHIQDWYPAFSRGMRTVLDPIKDFNSVTNVPDSVLHDFADLIVGLGDQVTDDQQRWLYCCVLLPKDPLLPLQQRSLIVRAQSEKGHYKVDVDALYAYEASKSICLRAFQSGQII